MKRQTTEKKIAEFIKKAKGTYSDIASFVTYEGKSGENIRISLFLKADDGTIADSLVLDLTALIQKRYPRKKKAIKKTGRGTK